MRKIPDIELHLTDPKAPKFIDLAPQKEVDNEAQELLKSLRNKKVPNKVQSTNLTQVGLPKSVVFGQLWLRFYSELLPSPRNSCGRVMFLQVSVRPRGWGGGFVSNHAIGQEGVCQHAIGQGVCLPLGLGVYIPRTQTQPLDTHPCREGH